MNTNDRYTTDLTTARPSKFGATAGAYVDAEKRYSPLVLDVAYTVIEAGGVRLARTTAGVTRVVTTLGDVKVAAQVRDLVSSLTRSLPHRLYRLGCHAAGTPLDLPRLGRHIWATGTDPWDDERGATGDLAALSRITGDLPEPVRATIAALVFETWDWMGPVLVPAKAVYCDNWTGDEEAETFDVSAVMATAADYFLTAMATEGRGEHEMVAALSWLDTEAQRVMRACDLEEGVNLVLGPKGRAAARAWITVHRPDLLAAIDAETA